MLPPDALAALDRLPPGEALHRPLLPDGSAARRVSRLLSGEEGASEQTTVGDALFRWVRTEREAFEDAGVTDLHQISQLVAACGQIPRRLSLSAEIRRSAAGTAASTLNLISGSIRSYHLQTLVSHLYDAQGCEAYVGGADASPTTIVLNSLRFVVHDPSVPPPTKIEGYLLMAEDMVARTRSLSDNPFVHRLGGISSGLLDGLLPAADAVQDVMYDASTAIAYATAAAQVGRLFLHQDTDSLVRFSSLASSGIVGHLGQVAGQAAAVAMFGLAGSWMVVLAPLVTGLAGRVVARNLARRARYLLLCRREVALLKEAISAHCLASRDAVEIAIASSRAHADGLQHLHGVTTGPTKLVIADWLDRIDHIQSYRRLIADRLYRSSVDSTTLDHKSGDPLRAAQEGILMSARVGLHPANVAKTARGVLDASQALQRRLKVAMV